MTSGPTCTCFLEGNESLFRISSIQLYPKEPHLRARSSSSAMAESSPPHKVTDLDARWDAEDLFSRLCIVAHAAFLYAGCLPHSAPAATPGSVSRHYSVLPQAARRDGAAAVVLRLSRPWGRRRRRDRRSRVTLRAYVASDGARHSDRRERLDIAALAAVLSGGVDDAIRAMKAPGSGGERLWRLLADGIGRCLFLDACRLDGVPADRQPGGFASLPGEIKVAILERLDDGKDVARAACTCKEMRDLVADHDRALGGKVP
ncbi:hypothetical protein ACP70R_019772 [Stipagrostis hirtigluma subsp. patula]